MNIINIQKLSENFKLGNLIAEPVRIYGGLLHLMYRIETDSGIYAIKQLNQNIDLNNQKLIDNYNLTENIARQFASMGIRAISALELNYKSLMVIDNIGYLVYPWIDAKLVTDDNITKHHIVRIAKVLANIHKINLDIDEIQTPQFDIHSSSYIISLIDKAQQDNNPFASDLFRYKDTLVEINNRYKNATGFLVEEFVISHNDLDPKNVLWTENNDPILIDWESAKAVNPTYDIINIAIDWSSNVEGLNAINFKKMILAYQAVEGIINYKHIEPGLGAVLGNMINWLAYNIERACDKTQSSQKEISIKQIKQTLDKIIKLSTMIPSIIDIILNLIEEKK